MRSVLLSPHHDDETLFASFICQRERPRIVACLDEGPERLDEFMQAVSYLDCDWEQWDIPASNPNWDRMERFISELASKYDHCYAPSFAFEENGHSPAGIPPRGWGILQHDMVGMLAARHFEGRITHYTTYRRWHGRERGQEVSILKWEWVLRKLQALACYRSQIEAPPTMPHFLESLREYVR